MLESFGRQLPRQPQPHPDEAIVRAQNARRLANRAALDATARAFQRTDFAALRRGGGDRGLPGQARIEALQEVPERTAGRQRQLTRADFRRFFSQFQFAPTEDVIDPRESNVPHTFVLQRAPRAPFGRAARRAARARGRFSRRIP